MKTITINGMPYVIKFNTRALANMNAKGVTLGTLGEKLEKQDFSDFYIAFHEGVRTLRKDIDFDGALEIIDGFVAMEENSIEDLLFDTMEEIAVAMGLGKRFKEGIQEQKEKQKAKA